MSDRNLDFEDLPPLIGPIKKSNKMKFDKIGFSELDDLTIEHFEEFYLDYDGFYALLEMNNFNFSEYLDEVQHEQISELAKYFHNKKDFDKSIKLVKCKHDWLIDIYTSEELYEKCADVLAAKKKFLEGIDEINKKFNTEYGKEK